MERWEKKRKKESKKQASGAGASQVAPAGGPMAVATTATAVAADSASAPPTLIDPAVSASAIVTGANAIPAGTVPVIQLAPNGTGGTLQKQSLASVVEVSENVADIFPNASGENSSGQDPTAPLGVGVHAVFCPRSCTDTHPVRMALHTRQCAARWFRTTRRQGVPRVHRALYQSKRVRVYTLVVLSVTQW
eukprot:m.487321 g.487321  ORF g.487321 m.487321 type:complete len:191 (-) comp21752_c0_seq6:86-658(-)